MVAMLLLILLSFILSFSDSDSDHATVATNSTLSYPNKTIPTNSNDDSFRVTSIPKVLNWTHTGDQYFIIFDELKFDPDFMYVCVYKNKITTFVKPLLKEDIYGFCNTEIKNENEFIFAKCQKKFIKNDEIDCDQEYFVENKKEKNPYLPKNETKNVATESETNYILWFLIISGAGCLSNLGAEFFSYTFFTYVKPLASNLYIRYIQVPTDENT
uniref:Uncharacterized protein n=1 Tax=Panagrolaimus sp. PS1159 TaxID=55785 RepID=A0AC35FIS0_9BILA